MMKKNNSYIVNETNKMSTRQGIGLLVAIGVLCMGWNYAWWWSYGRILYGLVTWEGELALSSKVMAMGGPLQWLSEENEISSQLFGLFLNNPSLSSILISDNSIISQEFIEQSDHNESTILWTLEHVNMNQSHDCHFRLSTHNFLSASIDEIASSITQHSDFNKDYPPYSKTLHVINFIPTVNNTKSSREENHFWSSIVIQELQKQLHADTVLRYLDFPMRIMSYDWPIMPPTLTSGSIDQLSFWKNKILDVQQSFDNFNVYMKNDIFIFITSTDSNDQNLQIFSGFDSSTDKDSETRTMLVIGGPNIIANESERDKIASFSRDLVRKHVLSFSWEKLLSFSKFSLSTNFISSVVSNLSHLDVTQAEMSLELLLRKHRQLQIIQAHLLQFRSELLADPWKVLACSSDHMHSLVAFISQHGKRLYHHQEYEEHFKSLPVSQTFSAILTLGKRRHFPSKHSFVNDMTSSELAQIQSILVEERSTLFVAGPTLASYPQMLFIMFGPFWIPLLVPMFRILLMATENIFASSSQLKQKKD